MLSFPHSTAKHIANFKSQTGLLQTHPPRYIENNVLISETDNSQGCGQKQTDAPANAICKATPKQLSITLWQVLFVQGKHYLSRQRSSYHIRGSNWEEHKHVAHIIAKNCSRTCSWKQKGQSSGGRLSSSLQQITSQRNRERFMELPSAASSIELPWPMTAVSIRLINGPQIHKPVAGPANTIISFIWSHKLWSESPLLFASASASSPNDGGGGGRGAPSPLPVDVSASSSAISWLGLRQAATNRSRPRFASRKRGLDEARATAAAAAGRKRRGGVAREQRGGGPRKGKERSEKRPGPGAGPRRGMRGEWICIVFQIRSVPAAATGKQRREKEGEKREKG